MTQSATDRLLTPREYEILVRIAAGDTRAQISAALGITYNTIRSHIAHILEKTGGGSLITSLAWVGWLRLPTSEERAGAAIAWELHEATVRATAARSSAFAAIAALDIARDRAADYMRAPGSDASPVAGGVIAATPVPSFRRST